MTKKYSVVLFAEEGENHIIDIAKKIIHKFQDKGIDINLVDLRHDLEIKTGFVISSKQVNKFSLDLKTSDKIIFIYSSTFHTIPSAVNLFITQVFLQAELSLKKDLINVVDISPSDLLFSRFVLRSSNYLWWKRFIQPEIELPIKIYRLYKINAENMEKQIKKIDFRTDMIASSILDKE